MQTRVLHWLWSVGAGIVWVGLLTLLLPNDSGAAKPATGSEHAVVSVPVHDTERNVDGVLPSRRASWSSGTWQAAKNRTNS